MWDQQILPFFTPIGFEVCASSGTPLDTRLGLFRYVVTPCTVGVSVLRAFGLNHQDVITGFRDKVWNVFWMLGASFVVHLELTFGGFKPFDRVSFENNRKTPLSI